MSIVISQPEPPKDQWGEVMDAILTDRRAAAEFRIIRATRRLLIRDGLDISVDAIAEEAGVGRRTVFRYFPSRDDLIAAALNASLFIFERQVREPPKDNVPFDEWMYGVVSSLYSMQGAAGLGVWQLASTEDRNLPEPIAAVNAKRREQRKEGTLSIAQSAWDRLGKSGDVPRKVELMFAMAISSFSVRSLAFDYEADDDEVVRMITNVLVGYLQNIDDEMTTTGTSLT